MSQVFLTLLILFFYSRIFWQFRRGAVLPSEFVLWSIFWGGAEVAIIFPNWFTLLANYLGIAHGSDLLVYLSLMLLFYLVFRILLKLTLLERKMTQVVRAVAINEEEKKK